VRKSCQNWNGGKRNQCYEAGQSIARRLPAQERIADDVHAQLLLPFTDVFRQVAQRLTRWLEQGHLSTLPVKSLPSVVIVTSSFAPNAGAEGEAKKAFLWVLPEETSEDPFQQISAIDVVAPQPRGATSAKVRFWRVKEHLRRRARQVQKNRENHQLSFSATHLAAFFRLASIHFAVPANTPFDFVRAARTFNTVAPDMHAHFSNFLKDTASMHQLTNFPAPMIAFSLLLDSYPPDAHGRYLMPNGSPMVRTC
jgi:hypothetical protein